MWNLVQNIFNRDLIYFYVVSIDKALNRLSQEYYQNDNKILIFIRNNAGNLLTYKFNWNIQFDIFIKMLFKEVIKSLIPAKCK